MHIDKMDRLKIFGATEEQLSFLEKRSKFVEQYFKDKGWDINNPTMEQTLEIRKQEGWKNPK